MSNSGFIHMSKEHQLGCIMSFDPHSIHGGCLRHTGLVRSPQALCTYCELLLSAEKQHWVASFTANAEEFFSIVDCYPLEKDSVTDFFNRHQLDISGIDDGSPSRSHQQEALETEEVPLSECAVTPRLLMYASTPLQAIGRAAPSYDSNCIFNSRDAQL